MFRIVAGAVMTMLLTAPLIADEATELKAYMRGLKSSAPGERIQAARDMAKLGEAAAPAVPLLCETIADPNTKVAAAALEALEKVDPKIHKDISTMLLDRDSKKRDAAVRDLRVLENAEAAVPVLIVHLRNRIAKEDDFFGVPGEISSAVELLQKHAEKNPAFAKVLIDASGPLNKRSKSRAAAIKALGEIAEHHEKLASQMRKVLSLGLADRSPDTRAAAAKAAGGLGTQGKDMVSMLRKLKLDPDSKVREAAEGAVDKIQGK